MSHFDSIYAAYIAAVIIVFGCYFTSIINSPEVAIIGIGKTETKQIFIDGKFIARAMMPVSVSYDHRIIDGAEAARFCQDLKLSLGKNFAFNLSF